MTDPVLVFSQGSGVIKSPNGDFVAIAWAGHGLGKNNPSMQEERNVGPLPRGLYKVGPWEKSHPPLGPLVAHLEQIEGETFGRSAFYFHGPSMKPEKYGQESEGCIVVPRSGREIVAKMAPEGSIIQVTA